MIHLKNVEYIVVPQGGTMLTETAPHEIAKGMTLFLQSLGFTKPTLERKHPANDKEQGVAI